VLGTGGTIAGSAASADDTTAYQAGVLGVEALLSAVGDFTRHADVSAEQVANINSKDMTTDLWVQLAARVNALLADDALDGIVITHGTDTLEETAYWLHLCVKSAKPVVLTAAMRPASSLSADGPLNLRNALVLAAHPAARGKGVLVALSNQIHCARDVTKTSTYSVDTFRSPDLGVLGWVQDGRVEFQRAPTRPHTLATPFSGADVADAARLPTVHIVTSYAGASRVMIDALVASGVRGIVVAGSGNGSIHEAMRQGLVDAVAGGVAVVRASRVGSGHVMHNGAANDDACGFISAGSLNPYKARVLLTLALAKQPAALQDAFDTY
jgi:L-asparaginase